MATCGGLHQHIFEMPLPESLSSWIPFGPVKSIDHSFTDPFKDVSLNDQNLVKLKRNEDSAVNSYSSKKSEGYCSLNDQSLQMCTEGLGFESLDDVEDLKNGNSNSCMDRNIGFGFGSRQRYCKKAKRFVGSLPPPISSVRGLGKPSVFFKSFRQDGRFVLKEIRISKREYLHASREDGRLRLSFVDEDDDDEDENGEDDDDDDDDDERKCECV